MFSCLHYFGTVLYCAHVRIRSLICKSKRNRCWDGGQTLKRVSGVDTLKYLFVEYVFTAYLLCAGHCSRSCRFSGDPHLPVGRDHKYYGDKLATGEEG